MDVVSSIVSMLTPLIDPVKQRLNVIKHYNRNVNEVDEKHKELKVLMEHIDKQVTTGKTKLLEKPTPLTENLLKDVKKMEQDMELKELMDKEARKAKDKCFFGVCKCNLMYRYDSSKLATRKARRIEEFIRRGRELGRVTEPLDLDEMEDLPTDYVHGLGSFEKCRQQVMDKLRDNDVDAVGIYGMPGIGKTMLAKHIKSEAKRIFGTVVMAEVKDMNDIQSIQDQIAADIFRFSREDSIPLRRKNLYSFLLRRMQDEEGNDQNKLEKKDRKLLVIFDNICNGYGRDWMINVGIPFPNKNRPFACKILVTSREKGACAQMVNKTENIVNLGLLTDQEASYLFKEQVGESNNDEKTALGERICKSCGQLPLKIKLVANLLKGQDLLMWENIASELEKPLSGRSHIVGSLNAQITPIVESSYRSLQGPCKMFFLLVCLFPKGSSIPIEELMRFGIGLELFQNVDDVDEALMQATILVNDLVASSLLLRDESELFRSHVKIHEVVRDSALLLAKQDGHWFWVDAIPKLVPIETFKDYAAISVTERDQDLPRLKELESTKLQTLILKGNNSSELDNAFFQGKSSLKLLVLSNMTFNKAIPNSTQRLTHIKTLQLESCKLGDVRLIGELRQLLVLSFRNSIVSELTDEMKLTQLQLLDLTSCQLRRIPAGVLASFSQLHFLYMLSCYSDGWKITEGNNGSVSELSSLRKLTKLELQVAKIEQLPNDDQIFANKISLVKFFIFVGGKPASQELEQPKEYKSILWLESVSLTSVMGHKYLFFFLTKTECLVLNKVRGLRNVVPYYNLVEGFMLNNLRELRLCDLEMLAYALPLHLVERLRIVTVSSCKSMDFIFVKDKKSEEVGKLPLKKLQLTDLPQLQSILGEINQHVSNNSSRSLALINKVKLPSLETLLVQKCSKIGKIWDVPSSGDLHSSSFLNLKSVTISMVWGLESLLSPSIAKALPQLEDLSIRDCKDMKEVISSEIEEVGSSSRTITFPKLKHFLLSELSSLKYFYGGSYEIQFPVLKELKLNSLGSFEVFTGGAENCRSFFHGKMSFPCLEELWTCQINSQQHKELWAVDEQQSIDPVPQLRLLELHEGTTRPTDWSVFKRVRYVSIGDITWDYIFEAEDLANTKNSLQFEILEIRDCKNLKTVIKSDPIEEEIIEKSSSEIELPQLKRIAAISCAKMESFYSSSVGSSGENGSACVLKLPTLEKLSLEDCKNVKKFSSGRLKGSRSIKYEISMDGRTVMEGESNDINTTLKDPRVRGIFKIQVKYA